ncbi:type VI secretion system tube protein TssD [Aquimarina pacifica]|uniref:type VI secretion system tube protein TssD n=1 Tax=Aquimarina pacifica TaxID=1296415 RepID=UPI00046EA50F|nr:type VI secretion system tube protein TssD [Aquimarina pacifica]
MSFKAKLKVDGNEYNVLFSSYSLSQETDATGRPSSVTRGGMVTIKVESTSDSKLSDWMFNNFEMKSGSIAYLKRDTDATSKELKFTDAYAVKYNETFDSTGKEPMVETITISAREISVKDGVHTNEWV